MAKVKPFRGIRPPRQMVTEVASRPYDVLNSEEARAEAEGNPKSLYHIIKPEIDFAPGTDEHAPEVYDKAVENFAAFRRNGWLAGALLHLRPDHGRPHTVRHRGSSVR